MRRSIEDALLALRVQVKAWASGAPADVRVFVYPPEWEALMLARLPIWAQQQADQGLKVELVDIGQAFARKVVDRHAAGPVAAMERRGSSTVMHSLRTLSQETVVGEIRRPLEPGSVARLLVNTGSLATMVSFSAITNEFHGAAERPPAAVAIAFPGEGDDRTLSLLNLRPDANYRVPRI
jgi:hypothetical protein